MNSGKQSSRAHLAKASGVTASRVTPSRVTASQVNAGIGAIGLAALGVVFGDIGTSPLYTLKSVIELAGGNPSRDAILGILSLIFWTLLIITTIKYVSFAMRIDNDGEGGILALMSLIGVKRHRRPAIVAVGLFGAALIYGDGAITPAISVLSALEGLEIATPNLKSYIVPLAVAILAGLFIAQTLGTARIGRAFGPIMATWFLVIAILGVGGIVQNPSVLAALNPLYAIGYLGSGGHTGFLVLGGVFLCVTGAEALYADMGHFGARPIRVVWNALVFPSLLLNYAGQAAVLLAHGATSDNTFYRLCPAPLLLPLIMLATVATVIASQSIITGAFSMTRQAIRLGWMPRMHITQTSDEGYGQIYVAAVNWLLMLVTIGLVLAFQKSDNLAAAYGIAVSATMLMTTVLLFIAMREIWNWNLPLAGGIAGAFFLVDSAFFLTNIVKIEDGGYVPLLLAMAIYTVMYVWHRGMAAIADRFSENPIPIETFMTGLPAAGVVRAPGTAVFLTRARKHTPPVLAWYVGHARALQVHVFAIIAVTTSTPWVAESERFSIEEVAPDFWRAVARYGFMERPIVPRLLERFKDKGCKVDSADVTYFVGHETIVSREDGKGLPRWMVSIFAVLHRNATHVTDVFHFPRDRVIEIGRQVAI
jgi:KUP system potassium uptake protein